MAGMTRTRGPAFRPGGRRSLGGGQSGRTGVWGRRQVLGDRGLPGPGQGLGSPAWGAFLSGRKVCLARVLGRGAVEGMFGGLGGPFPPTVSELGPGNPGLPVSGSEP